MKYYYTYLHNFKFKTNVTDPEQFLLSGGERGQIENHLTQNSDRITRLIDLDHSSDTNLKRINIDLINQILDVCAQRLEKIGFDGTNTEKFYTRFTIPKASGGVRYIDAPSEELKDIQEMLLRILKDDLKLLSHNNAHAYTEKKSTATNAEYHRKSNHFAKVDFSDFFGSIRPGHLHEILPKIGFFSNIFLKPHQKTLQRLLKMLIDASTLRGGLPQGAKTSPFLSNLVMIPFDYHMIKLLQKEHPNIIYTRYADDITFSSYYAFADKKEDAKKRVESIVNQIIQEHYTFYDEPMLTINSKKTTISTKFGKNRVTGIKINKDNNLSIGYREKRDLKQNLANLIIAKKNGHDIMKLHVNEIFGMFAYLKGVEPDYAKYIESTLIRKFKLPTSRLLDYFNYHR